MKGKDATHILIIYPNTSIYKTNLFSSIYNQINAALSAGYILSGKSILSKLRKPFTIEGMPCKGCENH